MATSSQPVTDLPGLSPAHGAALAQLKLTTIDQLYRYGQSAERCQGLATRLQVPRRYVTKWVVLAGLARVPGVGCDFNGLLLHAGLISVEQLATSSPQTLYTQVKRLHVATLQRADLCPTPDQVNLWIQNARAVLQTERHTEAK
ncbi:MAG: DUF4332 domain-containing protein [Nodosilinea sp.]